MSYSFQSRVRFSELDETGRLSLHSVLNYFQDCSTFHSLSIGQDMKSVTERNRVWVLSSWQVVIQRYPEMGEDLVVTTWPYEFRGFLGSRNFTLETGDGERLAYANTLWSFLNLETGTPERLREIDIRGFVTEPKLEMAYAPRKIAVPGHGEEKEPILVTSEHLDTNHHVNNAQYVALAQRYLPKGFVVHEMRAEYKSQTRRKDVMIPEVTSGEKVCTVLLRKPDGQEIACVEFR